MPEPSPVWSRGGAEPEPSRSRRWQAFCLSKHHILKIFHGLTSFELVNSGLEPTLTSFELVKAHIFLWFSWFDKLWACQYAQTLNSELKAQSYLTSPELVKCAKLWAPNSEFRAIWQALSMSNEPKLWAQNSKLRAQELWWELNRVFMYSSGTRNFGKMDCNSYVIDVIAIYVIFVVYVIYVI